MSANHVVMGRSVPVTTDAPVTSVCPIRCKHCGDEAWIGMPLSTYSLVAITNGFLEEHHDCQPAKQ